MALSGVPRPCVRRSARGARLPVSARAVAVRGVEPETAALRKQFASLLSKFDFNFRAGDKARGGRPRPGAAGCGRAVRAATPAAPAAPLPGPPPSPARWRHARPRRRAAPATWLSMWRHTGHGHRAVGGQRWNHRRRWRQERSLLPGGRVLAGQGWAGAAAGGAAQPYSPHQR